MRPENWNQMTPDDKYEARLAGYVSTEGKPFATPQAAKAYRERAQRFVDIVRLKQPDHVPYSFISGAFPVHYAGATLGDMFYDNDKTVAVNLKWLEDFAWEYQTSAGSLPGKAFDRIGYKTYRWPGGTLKPTQPFQYVEGEYMLADEYDALIADPEGFFMRTYMPRVFGALGGLQMLPSMYAGTEIALLPALLAPFGRPAVQQALTALMEAGTAMQEWAGATARAGAVALGEMGLPKTAGGFSKAPFDFIGDTLRGTRGIMMDMFRRPAKILAACEALVPIAIQMGVNAANASAVPFITIPLHKGADGFMSNADFGNFYWPSLKALLLGLIAEGTIPALFVEGGYNQRLDIIAESRLPAGKTIWLFDKTDMAAAKQKIGSWACIGGNVPASLFATGTPQQMDDCVKQLMEVCAPGGGYYLSPGAVIDDARAENVHAYIDAAQRYGVY